MGTSSSYLGFTEQMLEEYESLTYLSRSEILNLYKKFYQIGPIELDENFHFRFPCEEVELFFPQLMHNPFKHRIFRVFSSRKDYRFSFEDFLDLCSVMSEKCPEKIKAAWAFRVYDFDENGVIGIQDIVNVISLLTTGERTQTGRSIDNESKLRIAHILLEEMDIQSVGSVGPMEFEHAVGKMTEFVHSFSFRV